jgi:hypothetical protein
MVSNADVMPAHMINIGEGMWVNVRSMPGFVERGIAGELSRRSEKKQPRVTKQMTTYQIHMKETMSNLRENNIGRKLSNAEIFKLSAKMWTEKKQSIN